MRPRYDQRHKERRVQHCNHDWRVDPNFIFSGIPPAYRYVCCKCRATKIVTHQVSAPYTDDPTTWPRPTR